MHDQADAFSQTHQPKPPRHAFAKKQFLRVMQRRLADKLAFAAHQGPFEFFRKATHAGFARRILDSAACGATLQLQSPQCRAADQAERDPAAAVRRQGRRARPQDWVLALRSFD